MQIIKIEDDRYAIVELGGVSRKISLDLVDNIKIGDYVIVHAGFAIQKLDEEEATQTLKLLEEIFINK